MRSRSRKILDRSFTGLSVFSTLLVAAALLVLLGPIVVRGARAFVFRATVEHRRAMHDLFGREDPAALAEEQTLAADARAAVYSRLSAFERELPTLPRERRRELRPQYAEVQEQLRKLLGPLPSDSTPRLPRNRYGATRWDRAQHVLHQLLNVEQYDHSDPTRMGRKFETPRVEQFRGTQLEPLFDYVAANAERMLRPRWNFYWRFLSDDSVDAHFFGGIWPAVLGTLYLTIGAILFAVPMGVISAIYLAEYAGENWLIGILRTCISTLAGVPSIVFGLFGLAFFINTLHLSESRSVLAGSLTLALLILPVVIRASEEALRAVPATYKEAALSMGATRWRTVATVLLPSALPGVLTGIVISMGRAAGETAPIIFTAAVSAGAALLPWQVLDHGSPALPWNIYNIATEHAAVDEIRHVQYGMVLTLVLLVLLLNGAAIIMRARIARKLTG